MTNWKIKLDLKVSDNLVSDGINFSNDFFMERFKEHLRNFIPHAYYEIEFKVDAKILSAPNDEKILELTRG